MDSFFTIRFKRTTAARFKQFSKRIADTHSEAMDLILHFFEWHGFHPKDDLGKSVIREVLRNRKRMEANIAILKNVEKSQTKPTAAMLLALLEGNSEAEEEENFDFGEPELISENEELIYYRNTSQDYQKKYTKAHNDIEKIINQTSYVKSSFGKAYWKLEITKDEFEKLKGVYHNNSTEDRR